MHTGVRNPTASFTHLVTQRFAVAPRISVSATGGLIQSVLYPLTEITGLPDEDGPSSRYAALTSVVAQYDPKTGCSIRTGVENYHGQLRPDGTRHRLLFNRNAQIFIDLVMTGDCFTSAEKGS